MSWSRTSCLLGDHVRTTLRLVALVLVVMVAMFASMGGSEACPSGEQATVAALTTSKAKVNIAIAEAGKTSATTFAATQSATPIIANVTHCCGQGSSCGPGSCPSASCPVCVTGIAIDGWMPAPATQECEDIVSPHRGVAACDLIPDLPPPRFA